MRILNQGGQTQKQSHSLSPCLNANHEEEGLHPCYVLNVSPQNSHVEALNPDVMGCVCVCVLSRV